MSREIEFRGFHEAPAYTGKEAKALWVYGFYKEEGGSHWIIDGNSSYVVDPESIGQFTGFKDKDLKKIFERDIIHQDGIVAEVIFRYGCFFISAPGDTGVVMSELATDFHNLADEYKKKKERPFCKLEIIGDTFNDSELLKQAS